MSKEVNLNSPEFAIFHEEDPGKCHVMVRMVRITIDGNNMVAQHLGSFMLEPDEFASFKKIFDKVKYVQFKESDAIELENFIPSSLPGVVH